MNGPAMGFYGTPQPMNQFTDPNNTTVFVGGLSGYVTEDELRSFFQGFGEITYVKIPPGKSWGQDSHLDRVRGLEEMFVLVVCGGLYLSAEYCIDKDGTSIDTINHLCLLHAFLEPFLEPFLVTVEVFVSSARCND
ncbi:hypothetical protein BDV95DRAFT_142772 [Massariosphaeria phaeospora]|uniref:RRM domain-containing protein n=1 Tax=Massariosphaeria phaeospora TaxID=100035 RepID=A0A7C8MFN5_9PLEO|nr:hypothetical protein BDV95DRAFT_142772 [Massariosphaeria phaeospora]